MSNKETENSAEKPKLITRFNKSEKLCRIIRHLTPDDKIQSNDDLLEIASQTGFGFKEGYFYKSFWRDVGHSSYRCKIFSPLTTSWSFYGLDLIGNTAVFVPKHSYYKDNGYQEDILYMWSQINRNITYETKIEKLPKRIKVINIPVINKNKTHTFVCFESEAKEIIMSHVNRLLRGIGIEEEIV